MTKLVRSGDCKLVMPDLIGETYNTSCLPHSELLLAIVISNCACGAFFISLDVVIAESGASEEKEKWSSFPGEAPSRTRPALSHVHIDLQKWHCAWSRPSRRNWSNRYQMTASNSLCRPAAIVWRKARPCIPPHQTLMARVCNSIPIFACRFNRAYTTVVN